MARSKFRLLASSLLCTGLLASLTAQAFTKETTIGDNWPYFGRTFRSLGMGNAVLTVPAHDVRDMFYNAASLQDLPRHWDFGLLNLDLAISKSLYNTYKDVKNLFSDLDGSATQQGDLTVFRTFFNNRVGQFQTLEATIPLLTAGRKGWGAALLLDSRTTIALRDTTFANLEVRTLEQGGFGFGKSIGLLGNDLSIGVLAKGIYRVELDRLITENSVISGDISDRFKWNQWGKAFGFGLDLGARYKLPFLDTVHPVLAVTYQDVGNTRFLGSSTSDTRQSVNAALGLQPQFGDFKLYIEGGMSQLNQRMALMNRLHAGAELRFPRMGIFQLMLRGGTNQGYPTGGVTLDFKKFAIDGVFYGESKAEKTRPGAEYKYAVGISTKF